MVGCPRNISRLLHIVGDDGVAGGPGLDVREDVAVLLLVVLAGGGVGVLEAVFRLQRNKKKTKLVRGACATSFTSASTRNVLVPYLGMHLR